MWNYGWFVLEIITVYTSDFYNIQALMTFSCRRAVKQQLTRDNRTVIELFRVETKYSTMKIVNQCLKLVLIWPKLRQNTVQ